VQNAILRPSIDAVSVIYRVSVSALCNSDSI
jgi:hypothetical protein